MSGLIEYANRIALQPPVGVWREQSGAINPELGAHIERHKDEKDLIAQAGTVCDLTAYSLMVVGAGVERIAALKTSAARGKQTAGEGDGVHRFRLGDGDAFHRTMRAWIGVEGSGVIQFKFDPGGSWHTFVAERVWAQGTLLGFRVYQSYQGTYRLSDFLGKTSPKSFLEGVILSAHRRQFENLRLDPDTEPEEGRERERWKREHGKVAKELSLQTEAAQSAIRAVGAGEVLDEASFVERVVSPLRHSLEGGMSRTECQQLTGHAVKGSLTCAEGLMVVRCDTIDPARFEANYASLGCGRDESPGWIAF